MTVGTFAVVLARLLFSYFFSTRARLSSDDWALMATIPLGIPSAAAVIFGLVAHGLGTDIWGLQVATVVVFGHYFYVMEIMYVLLLTLVKLTLTLFYLNIFFDRTIRYLLWSTVVFHIAVAMVFTVGGVFACMPARYRWEQYSLIGDSSMPGQCIYINAGGWANGAISVASDIWLLAIPFSQVGKLSLHRKDKLCVGLMFLTGAM
ncbi:CFEM domain-containing protein [Cordyceps javanica]|uniref:CFEM domain-containing protein n=1 Tax=Cordyceps javanica TaxID=43265 RepID=A0A545VJI4_9HYPO|nr:CFEM domain-containing protein [Cordyceps javanica]TQW01898.1 CFEM domain-containing protein [Cordyceps javanica]